MLLMLSKTAFSQHLSITKVERDSIVSKIIRGNEAIEQNKVLQVQISGAPAGTARATGRTRP